MAGRPALNPHLAIHLTDRGLIPIISTSTASTPSSTDDETSLAGTTDAQALAALTTASLFAYDNASRLGYGLPQRLIVTTRDHGAIVSSSYLNPAAAAAPRLHLQHYAAAADGPAAADGHTLAVLAQTREALRPVSSSSHVGGFEPATATTSYEGGLGGEGAGGGDDTTRHNADADADQQAQYQAPLLVATVVARRADDAGEARKAAGRLERIGRDFQRSWMAERDVDMRREGDAV